MRNNKGFGLIAILLIIVAALTAGGVTYYVIKSSGYYSVGGKITGAVYAVTLLNNNKDSIIVNPAKNSTFTPFTFPATLANGASYDVTVATSSLGQQCSVANNIGIVNRSNVTDVNVTCGAQSGAGSVSVPATNPSPAGNSASTTDPDGNWLVTTSVVVCGGSGGTGGTTLSKTVTVSGGSFNDTMGTCTWNGDPYTGGDNTVVTVSIQGTITYDPAGPDFIIYGKEFVTGSYFGEEFHETADLTQRPIKVTSGGSNWGPMTWQKQ